MLNRKWVMLVGVILLMVSFSPTAWGMISAFDLILEGANEAQVERQVAGSVGLAFSPLFVAMCNIGILLVIVSLFLRRTD